ncbi:MAG: FAD-binding oxidoreductase [Candidatus Freyarchaeota archaeon]|nr:FAD-binding oxidoreductase [Candidatus Jordarchaeia archaeon]MBS7270125.1 FAD-binding oxidoreductase [Candidatus Jordarchaeia archaeon]MBS7280702.1 FAD-binding oxidoreductase [Candidatus Jordarchaeia archaeon]
MVTVSRSLEDLVVELKNAVGEQFVSDSPEDLIPYLRDSFSALGEKFFGKPAMPLVVVFPGNTEEIQMVIRIANKFRVPVLPVTFGTNMAGLTIPTVESSLILDLKRLDRIIEIDEESMTATIEPAVSYGRLDFEARKHGLKTVSKVGGYTGGLVGNFVSANMRPFNARYGWTDPVVSLEVVLPTGELLRTSSQAVPGFEKINPYVRLCFGPDFVGLFRGSLGSFGVITKMVVRLYPVGEKSEFLWYEFGSLKNLLSAIKETQRNDIGNSVMGYNAAGLYSIVMDYGDRKDPERSERMKSLIPDSSWYLLMEIEGAAEKVDVERKIVDRICLERNEGKLVRFTDEKVVRYLRDYTTHRGQAVMHQCNGGFFGFWCCMPLSKILPFIEEVGPQFEKLGLKDVICPDEPLAIRYAIIPFDRGTTMVCGISVEYDPLDKEQTKKLSEMVQPLIITMLKYGGTIPLTMQQLTDMLLMPSYAELIRGIKKLLDPNNILAPNKLC